MDRLGVPGLRRAGAGRELGQARRSSRDDLRLFISARRHGRPRGAQRPARGAADALLDANKDLKASSPRARASALTIPTLFPEERPPLGYLDPVQWRNYGGWMVDNGLLDELPDIDAAITNDLLPGDGPLGPPRACGRIAEGDRLGNGDVPHRRRLQGTQVSPPVRRATADAAVAELSPWSVQRPRVDSRRLRQRRRLYPVPAGRLRRLAAQQVHVHEERAGADDGAAQLLAAAAADARCAPARQPRARLTITALTVRPPAATATGPRGSGSASISLRGARAPAPAVRRAPGVAEPPVVSGVGRHGSPV